MCTKATKDANSFPFVKGGVHVETLSIFTVMCLVKIDSPQEQRHKEKK